MIPFDRYTTFSTCVIHLLFVVVIYITLLVFKPLMKKKCTCVTVITKTWWRFQTGIPECLQIQPDFESDSPNAFRLLSSGDHRGHSETRVRVSSHRKSSHVSCQGNCTMSPVTRNWYSFCFASNTKSCCREKFAKDFSRKGSTLKKWRKTSMTCQKEWKCPLCWFRSVLRKVLKRKTFCLTPGRVRGVALPGFPFGFKRRYWHT